MGREGHKRSWGAVDADGCQLWSTTVSADDDGVERCREHEVTSTDDRRAQPTAVRTASTRRRRVAALRRPAADKDQPVDVGVESGHPPDAVDVVVPSLVDPADPEEQAAVDERRHDSAVEHGRREQSPRRQRRVVDVVDRSRRHDDQQTDDEQARIHRHHKHKPSN